MNSIHILLVEDNAGDIRLTQEAFQEAKISNDISVVFNGEEAIDFLNRRAGYALAPRPDIILLDLNLPKKDGREVLREIKADPNFRRIPVVVLTTSQAEEDIMGVYDNYANCYIRKPVDFEKFLEVVRKIEDFWLSVVKLPVK